MSRKNWSILLALSLTLALPFAAACGGGQAPEEEEPVVEEPAEEEPAAEPEPAEPPVEEPIEESEPQQREIVGSVDILNYDQEWGESTPETAPYTWTVTVANNTTATLDVTVVFNFLDENDAVIKTERKSVRMAPATQQTVTGAGTMAFDDANRVYGFSATTDFTPVAMP